MERKFIKMNGCGNDFVIFDARKQPLSFTPEQVQKIAARDNAATKGCDQLIVMEPSADADVFMRIYNADGSEVGACGNATRCVAFLLDQSNAMIQTKAAILTALRSDDNRMTVCMGKPAIEWQEIPLAKACDTNHLPIDGEPSAVSMGNPHMVFVVKNVKEAPVDMLGPEMEVHPLYPEHANVGFAQVISRDTIKLRVWERGVGETQACGTGACAAVVALHRRDLVDNVVSVHLPGGVLDIEWIDQPNAVWMTGEVEKEFEGVVDVE